MTTMKELRQRIEEAGKDATWFAKLSAAATWEEYSMLLDEKGIKAPPEMKDVFNARPTGKAEKLEDNELKDVAGGWRTRDCNERFDNVLCVMRNCRYYVPPDASDTSGYSVAFCERGFFGYPSN